MANTSSKGTLHTTGQKNSGGEDYAQGTLLPAPAAGEVPLTLPACLPACRVVGSLKVCSRSLFFVPRDLQQPIFRIPYQHTTAITA
jgi:hypothetical protein